MSKQSGIRTYLRAIERFFTDLSPEGWQLFEEFVEAGGVGLVVDIVATALSAEGFRLLATLSRLGRIAKERICECDGPSRVIQALLTAPEKKRASLEAAGIELLADLHIGNPSHVSSIRHGVLCLVCSSQPGLQLVGGRIINAVILADANATGENGGAQGYTNDFVSSVVGMLRCEDGRVCAEASSILRSVGLVADVQPVLVRCITVMLNEKNDTGLRVGTGNAPASVALTSAKISACNLLMCLMTTARRPEATSLVQLSLDSHLLGVLIRLLTERGLRTNLASVSSDLVCSVVRLLGAMYELDEDGGQVQTMLRQVLNLHTLAMLVWNPDKFRDEFVRDPELTELMRRGRDALPKTDRTDTCHLDEAFLRKPFFVTEVEVLGNDGPDLVSALEPSDDVRTQEEEPSLRDSWRDATLTSPQSKVITRFKRRLRFRKEFRLKASDLEDIVPKSPWSENLSPIVGVSGIIGIIGTCAPEYDLRPLRRQWTQQRRVACLAAPPDWPAMAAEECEIAEEDPSTLNAAALVAGTTVGAGILALPQATLPAGYVPGCGALVGSWVFMLVSGLLIAETTTTAICETKRPGLGLLATSSRTLGGAAGGIAGLAYAFIHYALLVAYIAAGGELLFEAIDGIGAEIPEAAGGALFVATFGASVAFGGSKFVERLNSSLVVVVGLSFVGIVFAALPEVRLERLVETPDDWGAAFAAIPICVLAGVYHNIVPLLVTRFRGDRAAITRVIALGSAAPLVMFLVWNTLVCAAVDVADVADPVAQLRQNSVGADAEILGSLVAVFSLAAIVTSFFGFFYGLRSYLCDLFAIQDDPLAGVKPPPLIDAGLAAAIVGPPLVIATVSPDVFLGALDVAGTFGITLLFGVIPAATAWRQRQQLEIAEPFVAGGNVVLGLVIILASIVIGEGAYDQLQRLYLASPEVGL
ncbi:hypothetical protein CTAYLR_000232 [Chrysophaeum taylorii]|uniref:Tyrosine-specific transport protein n=1 Tax=Chrysophaeum taylorii TaxID=2483200 RepID=A0AAD7UGB5_9STRA|nr:hypothetical protein CTAYLR_000232 [Chrysophaeum taylorii]